VGFVDRNPAPKGKALLNSIALLHGGKIAARRAKSLLPTYDIFDEARYFEPAAENRPLKFKGALIGLTVCEDIWAETACCPAACSTATTRQKPSAPGKSPSSSISPPPRSTGAKAPGAAPYCQAWRKR
jgi:predicted amidohydrolase